MVLKLVCPGQLTVLNVRVISFRDHMLLQIDYKGSLGQCCLGVGDYPSEDNYLVLVFVVVEAAHVLEGGDLVR